VMYRPLRLCCCCRVRLFHQQHYSAGVMRLAVVSRWVGVAGWLGGHASREALAGRCQGCDACFPATTTAQHNKSPNHPTVHPHLPLHPHTLPPSHFTLHTSTHTMHTPHRPCRHSLDELEALVRDKFSAVPNGGISAPRFPPEATTQEQAGLLIRMVPEREGHSIELQVRQRLSRHCLWGVLLQGPWMSQSESACTWMGGQWIGVCFPVLVLTLNQMNILVPVPRTRLLAKKECPSACRHFPRTCACSGRQCLSTSITAPYLPATSRTCWGEQRAPSACLHSTLAPRTLWSAACTNLHRCAEWQHLPGFESRLVHSAALELAPCCVLVVCVDVAGRLCTSNLSSAASLYCCFIPSDRHVACSLDCASIAACLSTCPASLFRHEGEGSAFALLKARGWATALVAGGAGTSFRHVPRCCCPRLSAFLCICTHACHASFLGPCCMPCRDMRYMRGVAREVEVPARLPSLLREPHWLPEPSADVSFKLLGLLPFPSLRVDVLTFAGLLCLN
jgi:hypothetical protein